MTPEMLKAIAELVTAATLAAAVGVISVLAWRFVPRLLDDRTRVRVAIGNVLKLDVHPARGVLDPEGGGAATKLAAVKSADHIPSDYLYVWHTSFLKGERQAEFRARTDVEADHYHIHVVVDSYYEGALDRINFVEYVLHEEFPEPVQRRFRREDRFLLKELAYGEFVLLARVFLKDIAEPLVLQRYITLWKEGPRLEPGQGVAGADDGEVARDRG